MKRELFQFKYEDENRQNVSKIELRSIQTNVLMSDLCHVKCSLQILHFRRQIQSSSPVSTVNSSQKVHFLKVLKLTDSLFFSSCWKPLQKSIQNLSTVEMAAARMRGERTGERYQGGRIWLGNELDLCIFVCYQVLNIKEMCFCLLLIKYLSK